MTAFKALDAALLNIEKQYGKGSVMRLGDDTRAPLEVIPTGSIALDGLGARRRRAAARPNRRDVRPRVERQDNRRAARRGQRSVRQRHRGVHRRRAALDPLSKGLGVNTDALLVLSPAPVNRRSRSPTC